jgi:surface carbohydrate biosynthesis protein
MSLREKIDVLIYIEHPSRELDLAALYAYLLAKNYGLKVKLVPVFFRDYETFAQWDPKVVVFPNYYAPSKGSERTRSFFPKARFLNLSSEQIFSRLNFDRKAPKGDFALQHLSYLAWSPAYRDYLIEKGVQSGKVTVTGNPTYSLYLDPWQRKFQKRTLLAKVHGLDLTKRWIFFPENYGAAWFSKERREKMIADGADREGIEANHQTALKSLEEVCRWLHTIPEDIEIILRPRPATGKERFMEMAGAWLPKSHPRLKITDDGTVREWILASDSVVSSYSTSLIEAALAGKPIAMAQPFPLPPSLYHEFYDLVTACRTEEEWQSFLKQETAGDPKALEQWAKANFMAEGDPVLRVVEWMAEQVKMADQDWQPSRNLGPKAKFKDMLFKAKRALKGKGEKRLASDDLSPTQADEAVAVWAACLKDA